MAGTSPAMTDRCARRLPVRIRINQAAPAVAVERLPLAFRLREAIGHGIDGCGMVAHAAMAAFDLDAFGLRRALLHAALPGADAVGAAEDRGARHRRRARERSAETGILIFGFAAACHLIDS